MGVAPVWRFTLGFVLTGFRQYRSVRHYAFDYVSGKDKREACVVCADLNLLQKHKIPLQEVPLLCRRLLETADVGARERLEFSETDMLSYNANRSAQQKVNAKKKKHRVPVSPRVGLAWRGAKPEQK